MTYHPPTLVRSTSSPRLDRRLPEPLIQWVFRRLDQVSPRAAARIAEQFFMTPPRYAAPPRERDVLAGGHRFTVPLDSRPIAAWSWGSGPVVFLLHGWGGRGGQFFRFVPALVAAGLSVVLIDAPAHGETPGRQTTLRDFARALMAVVEHKGPARGIIAHSLGAAAATLALELGMGAERVVLIAPPVSPAPYLHQFATRLGLGEPSLRHLEQYVARRVGLPWEEISVVKSARKFRIPALVIADRNDEEVPLEAAEQVAGAWPGAELVRTVGWGHHRLLRAPDVIGRSVAFLG